MKRLLVLAYFYPPLAGGGVHRVLSFTRHLPAHGWACTVITAGPDDYWVRDASLLARVSADTEVLRVRGGSALATWLRMRGRRTEGRRSGGAFAPLRALSEWLLLPDSYAGWSRRAAHAAAERLAQGGVDAVLSSSPPDSVHLAAAEAVRGRGVPWVADFRDPWIGLHFRKPPTPWHAARHAAMESRVLTQADLVLAASRTHARELEARASGRPRRVRHLPNGFEPAPPSREASADPAHFRLVFTGTLSLMEDAGTLLAALVRVLAADTAARSQLRVELVGPYDADWQHRAQALGLGEVVAFSGPIAHAEARARQARADALLLWKPQAEGYRTMVPGKLYEYLDSARPVLALLPQGDEAAELVRRAGGRVLTPGDAAALAAEIASALARWRREGRAAGTRPEWLAAHTRAALAGELAGELDQLVAPGRA